MESPSGTMRFSPYQQVLLLAFAVTVCCGNVPQDSATVPAGSGDNAPALLNHLDEGTSPDASDLEFYRRLYDFDVGKRAYSYVSEYKRLPVYNFGLGKRSGGKLYGFGLGKRAGGEGRRFSFGLGKRISDEDEEYFYPESDEEISSGEEPLDDVTDGMDKRDRLYSFGLGKRARPYSFGLGKRAGPSMYSFGLGKRGGHNMYSFGLGKRADGRLYAFGLGKRPNYDGRMSGSRFNFGLGKRASAEMEDDDDVLEEAKRVPEHRFAFGLGKREIKPKELEAVKNEINDAQERRHRHDESDSADDVTKDEEQSHNQNNNGKHAVKRSLHYDFGLGKGTGVGYDFETDADDDKESINDEFARFARRPYGFGLGKRIPMYDFGIGKRAER
ncbi:allatostatins isoform X2 [Anabrus simplex]|uniref:allatostatins isoform X2 n=1 Tax=Anabrus simplex TaxID=316456 RepID=UPI0035A2DE3F